jgi:hypothetical protein
LARKENGLAGIGVPDPLVEYQGAAQINLILDLSHHPIGEKVTDRNPVRKHRHSRPEVQFGWRRPTCSSPYDPNLGILRQDAAGHPDNGSFQHEDLPIAKKGICQPSFIRMRRLLGIIRERDDLNSPSSPSIR